MEQETNKDLLDFFDAKDAGDYDRMFEALAKLSRHATEKEIGDICAVMDLPQPAGDVAGQIETIRNQLLTQRKYDGERLR